MALFETVLLLLVGATVLSVLARRLGVPYPALLAIGGALLAMIPGVPRLDLSPELIMCLFVAPILLDAAHDASLRDLRTNWLPILSMIVGAVALTTVAVALVARLFLPDLPWAAALALGALVAPPDAVAALAVMRQLRPPYRLKIILEGESLLNDASALLIYKLAVGAVAVGSFSVSATLPTFLITVVGGAAIGWLAARPISWLTSRFSDASSSVIFQFASTFGLWILVDHLQMSAVVAVVVFGATLSRQFGYRIPATIRIPSFAVWETATVILNVLAFTLIGLQIRPIIENLNGEELFEYLTVGGAILLGVIVVRLAWVMVHCVVFRLIFGLQTEGATGRSGLVVGWSGMRGIVTLAAAMALPADFPYRDFMQMTAFLVVLGTLVLQGMTLRPLIVGLQLPHDGTVDEERQLAHRVALQEGLAALDGEPDEATRSLRTEYEEALAAVSSGNHPRETRTSALRLKTIARSRSAVATLREEARIGDESFQMVVADLDRQETALRPDG